MSKVASQALVVPGPCVSVPEGMRRAISELFAVRTGMEQAFDVVHASATAHALDNPRYLVAMQSIDTLSQQVAAVERFLLNLSTELSEDFTIDSDRAAAGITIAAVAARLTAAASDADQDPGDCDFF
jgi:hypothetical protein